MTDDDKDLVIRRIQDWAQWKFLGAPINSAWNIEVVTSTGYRTSSVPVNIDGDAEKTHALLKLMPADLRATLVWHITGWVWNGQGVWFRPRGADAWDRAMFMDRCCDGRSEATYYRLLDRAFHDFLGRLRGDYIPPREPNKYAALSKMSLF